PVGKKVGTRGPKKPLASPGDQAKESKDSEVSEPNRFSRVGKSCGELGSPQSFRGRNFWRSGKNRSSSHETSTWGKGCGVGLVILDGGLRTAYRCRGARRERESRKRHERSKKC